MPPLKQSPSILCHLHWYCDHTVLLVIIFICLETTCKEGKSPWQGCYQIWQVRKSSDSEQIKSGVNVESGRMQQNGRRHHINDISYKQTVHVRPFCVVFLSGLRALISMGTASGCRVGWNF